MITKTLMKVSIIFQSFFCFFCISSLLCFAVSYYLDIRAFFEIGCLLNFGWILNPTGFLNVAVALPISLCEKSNEKEQKTVGKKWVWFIIFFLIDTLLYLITGVLMVILTGGI